MVQIGHRSRLASAMGQEWIGVQGKGKHPSKTQRAQKCFLHLGLGLGRCHGFFLLACWGTVARCRPHPEQGKEKLPLKIKKKVFRFLCLPNCSNGSSMPDLSPCKEKNTRPRAKEPVGSTCFCWEVGASHVLEMFCLFQYGCCSLGKE